MNKFILPVPYYDKEKEVLLYIENVNDKEVYSNNLIEPLEKFTFCSLYYPYVIKNEKKYDNTNFEEHVHTFEEVVKTLYDHPETFYIEEEQKKYYSEQELEYLKRMQKILRFYGLKDNINREDKTRYENELCKKYLSACKWKMTDSELECIAKKNLIFKVLRDVSEKEYKKNEYTALLLDEDYNVKLFIEFTNAKKVKFKDIKNNCIKKDIEDEEIVTAYYYKIIEKFN